VIKAIFLAVTFRHGHHVDGGVRRHGREPAGGVQRPAPAAQIDDEGGVLSAELKAFYMVARLGSITLAAKKLGLSQPTVTTQIRNLEPVRRRAVLPWRPAPGVSDEGARLLPMVKALLQQEADIEFSCATAARSRAPAHRRHGAVLHPRPGEAFRERLPQVEVSVEIGNSQQVLEAWRTTGSMSPPRRSCWKMRA
jgi:molybdenum-dependent DNA-binding transcriptional regulator ModE